MRQISRKNIRLNKGISLCCVVRNESLRLPYFIRYYKSLGVVNFFFIDNNSSDDTRKIILSEKLAHLFFTDEPFENKKNWLNYILNKYAIGNWFLVVDADELFFYPYMEEISLADLCAYLDLKGYSTLYAVLLDMFPRGSVRKSKYLKFQDFLKKHHYFDITLKTREKFFGLHKVLLDKFPLIKFRKGSEIWHGQHKALNVNIADIHGTLLHFKFFQDFIENRARDLALSCRHMLTMKEDAYSGYARETQRYYEVIKREKDLSFYDNDSVKFTSTRNLIELGIMRTSKRYEDYIKRKLLLS